jgi:hypothetical protein
LKPILVRLVLVQHWSGNGPKLVRNWSQSSRDSI